MDRIHDVIIISDCTDVIQKNPFLVENDVMGDKIIGSFQEGRWATKKDTEK